MFDWIRLGGASSADIAVKVLEYRHTPLPATDSERTEVPGRLSMLQSAYGQMEPQEITLRLAVLGSSRADIRARLRGEVLPWMAGRGLPLSQRHWTAKSSAQDDALTPLTVLQLDDEPERYYVGRVMSTTISEDTDSYAVLEATFLANPAVSQRALGTSAIPKLTEPIAEQISAQMQTAHATLSTAGTLPLVQYAGVHPAGIYIAVTGTWQSLTLSMGGQMLSIGVPATSSTTLYIDCDEQLCYRKENNQRISHAGAIGGDYPRMQESERLTVGGSGLNVTVRTLIIER